MNRPSYDGTLKIIGPLDGNWRIGSSNQIGVVLADEMFISRTE